jgi:hypothetical protein
MFRGRRHLLDCPRITGMKSPNKPDAVNPAIASQFAVVHHWRGVTDPERSAASCAVSATRKDTTMKTSLLVGLAIIAGQLAAYSQQPNQQQNQPAAKETRQAQRIEFDIHSVKIATNVSAYLGEGPAISPPPRLPFGGGGMSMIIMMKEDDGKTYSYMAGEITPTTNTALLVVECSVKNVSDTDEEFRPLDIGIGDERATLGALGAGDIPFAKDKAGLEKLRNTPPRIIPPRQSRDFIYVFTVPKDTTSWKLTYKKTPLSDLKEKDRPSK